MAKILVLYATRDGQTARIAARIGDDLRRDGHAVTLLSADAPGAAGAIEAHDAVIVGGGIRYGKYLPALGRLVKASARALAARPNAFYSVSLTGGGPGANLKVARGYVDRLVRRSGWRPGSVELFGGALLYTKYDPLIRTIIRFIVTVAGGDTDVSRDYEYTDWSAVERFAARFSREVEAVPARAAEALPA